MKKVLALCAMVLIGATGVFAQSTTDKESIYILTLDLQIPSTKFDVKYHGQSFTEELDDLIILDSSFLNIKPNGLTYELRVGLGLFSLEGLGVFCTVEGGLGYSFVIKENFTLSLLGTINCDMGEVDNVSEEELDYSFATIGAGGNIVATLKLGKKWGVMGGFYLHTMSFGSYSETENTPTKKTKNSTLNISNGVLASPYIGLSYRP